MKQQHINLLRAAANCLQSSLILDELIIKSKREINRLHKSNEQQPASYRKIVIETYERQLSELKQQSKSYMQQYADAMQQLIETPFVNLITREEENESNLPDVFQKMFSVIMS